jgi:hypothetical protein
MSAVRDEAWTRWLLVCFWETFKEADMLLGDLQRGWLTFWETFKEAD